MNTVTQTATKIISDSIFSSVYIDDKAIEPFTDNPKDSDYTVSKGIYDSFRQQQKTVDFYRFSEANDWKDDSEYLFKNRDLLILDWQLIDGQGLKQIETLRILKRAVQSASLHFVSIYTAADEKRDFPEILYTIKAYFNQAHNSDNWEKSKGLIQTIDDYGIDATSIFSEYKTEFKSLAFAKGDDKSDILNRLKSDLMTKLGPEPYKIFSKGIRSITSSMDAACELFGYNVNNEEVIDPLDFDAEVKIDFIADNFIVVNHTIIQITNKERPTSDKLLLFFTNAVQKVCGNLLTLVTLEMRNLLRESSGFVSKGADNISDAVLFHQQERKADFFEFLMSIVKAHTISYFDYKQRKLNSLNDEFWKDYASERSITASLANLTSKSNEGLITELSKLNVYYNILHVKRGEAEKIKFGDVFFSKSDGKYYLCITAHCDCLTPKNISSNFYFVRGQNHKSIAKLIESGDDVHCSYFQTDDGVIAVDWNSQPTVLRIKSSELQSGAVDGIDGMDTSFHLEYFATIKENYAQRMANHSFSHAMRVGIDFASLK